MIGEEPAYAELFIYQGSSFAARINFADSLGAALSLAGSSFAAQIRKSKDGPVVQSFTTSVSGSSLTLSLSATDTAAITGGRDKFDPEASYFFDLDWIQPGGTRRTPIAGKAFVVAEVTR